MDLLKIVGILSVALIGVSEAAGVLPDYLDAAVGGTVMFSPTLSTNSPLAIVTWSFGESNVDIVQYTPSLTAINPQYTGRIEFFSSSGSLELRDISIDDSGPYRVTIATSDGNRMSGSTVLTVHAPITGAQLNVSSEDLLEFNSSVTFSCSVSSGSSLSFLWQNISSQISASDGVQITDGGAKLTILNVTRYDQGPFSCNVSNPVSWDISNPVALNISYGPDDVDLQVFPSKEYFEEGSDITLNCSSSSHPPARLQWFFNTVLIHSGPELSLSSATEAQSGNYSCQAFNSRTLRYRTSAAAVTVLAEITDASLTPSMNVSIEGSSLTLRCDSTGTVYSRLWRVNGTSLTLDDNMMLVDENRNLSFKSLRRSDNGVYSCIQSNPLFSQELSYSIEVNFGPDPVTITGPAQVKVNTPFSLTCTAESSPVASFTWKHNGTERGSSSIFTVEEAQWTDSGSYSCEARNSITGKTESKTHVVSVTAVVGSSCSGGCIAAIVVSIVIVVIAVAVGLFFYCRRRKSNKLSSRQDIDGENNPSFADNQEVNYAEVRFQQKPNGQSVQFGSSDQSTEYAEVRAKKTPSSPPTYDAHVKRVKNRAPRPGLNNQQS